jgi:hypothetical protein
LRNFLRYDGKDEKIQQELYEKVDPLLLRIAHYMPFAVNHNWTPKQVDTEIPAHMLPDWNGVENVYRELKAEREGPSG